MKKIFLFFGTLGEGPKKEGPQAVLGDIFWPIRPKNRRFYVVKRLFFGYFRRKYPKNPDPRKDGKTPVWRGFFYFFAERKK